MVHLVLAALFTAGFAHVGAQAANRLRMFTVTRHRGRGESADLGAVDVKRDAPSHGLDVWFLQASRCAMTAGGCARVAGVDTRCVLLVGHLVLLLRCRGFG